MATRQEAEKALREYGGQEEKAGPCTLIDGGDGRWLVLPPGGPLAIDRDGHMRRVGEVFSSQEYWRLSGAWAV
jgi:hypothetical protein